MPIINEFEYRRPKSLDETLRLLKEFKGTGRVLAGGTDLVGWLKEGAHTPRAVVDIKDVPELGGITEGKDGVHIGARATFSEVLESRLVRRKLPLLWECSRAVACGGIRNRATLAGNICSAVPCMDAAPGLLCYEAGVKVASDSGIRVVPVSQWFLGPKKTAIAESELVTGVVVPVPAGKHAGCYVKLRRYKGEDLAQVGLALLILPKNRYRVAYGAVGPTPMRAERIEAFLEGKRLTPELLAKAKRLVSKEIAPITDVRASKEYRLLLSGVMLERGLLAAQERFKGKGPALGENVI